MIFIEENSILLQSGIADVNLPQRIIIHHYQYRADHNSADIENPPGGKRLLVIVISFVLTTKLPAAFPPPFPP